MDCEFRKGNVSIKEFSDSSIHASAGIDGKDTTSANNRTENSVYIMENNSSNQCMQSSGLSTIDNKTDIGYVNNTIEPDVTASVDCSMPTSTTYTHDNEQDKLCNVMAHEDMGLVVSKETCCEPNNINVDTTDIRDETDNLVVTGFNTNDEDISDGEMAAYLNSEHKSLVSISLDPKPIILYQGQIFPRLTVNDDHILICQHF